MNRFKRWLLRRTQRLNRHYGFAHAERVYQTNYLYLAGETEWLEEAPLSSPGAGGGSYSLLYWVLAVLRSGKVSSLLELGSGLSTRLLLPYVSFAGGRLVVVEHDPDWHQRLPEASEVFTPLLAPLEEIDVLGKSARWYGCGGSAASRSARA